jgi:hypothetical protein
MLIDRNLIAGWGTVTLCCLGLIPGTTADESGAELTVNEAIARAFDMSSGHNIFNRNVVKNGEVLPNNFRRIQVSGEKQADGSIVVRFSLPVSSAIDSEGRLATERLLEVSFTAGREDVRVCAADPDVVNEADEEQFLRALGAVLCSRKPPLETKRAETGNRIEFGVMISRLEQGLLVLVERIPYEFGGHTGYTISKDNKILRIGRGR